MIKKIYLLLCILTVTNFAQQVVDKIVAVVDNEIILQSELDYKTALLAAQNNIAPDAPGLKERVLNSLIEEKLVFASAQLDSITVTADDINRQIQYQVDNFLQQFGSKERLEQVYGMTLEKIKREMRDEVEKSLMIQRVREKKFAEVEVTRREVEEFFVDFKDSIGAIPEKVKLRHIFRNPNPSEQLKKKYFDIANAIRDSLLQGADFGKLASRWSEDPGSAAEGGDLGFVRRGVFFPEFESAAFALEVNEISEVTESPVGFHIIQLLERRGETIRSRHILIKIKADADADLNTISFLNELRDSIVRFSKPFEDVASRYSEDKQTAKLGGDLGTLYLAQLDKNLLDIVATLKRGEVSFPKRINFGGDRYGYHIVWLEDRVQQHQPDLTIDYPEVKNLALEFKKQNLYTAWIEELRGSIYWEIKAKDL